MMTKYKITSRFLAVTTLLSGMLLGGCEIEETDGEVSSDIALPLATRLDLFCEDMGVGFEDCVLEDPNNPYRNAAINSETKFDLHPTTPSSLSNFYLWATAQAITPRGENQWYTASALHRLYADSITAGEPADTQEVIRLQALKAYRALLDNHITEVTFFGPFGPDESFIPASVTDLSLAQLYRPIPRVDIFNPPAMLDEGDSPDGFVSLFADLLEFEATLGEWGYTAFNIVEDDPATVDNPATIDVDENIDEFSIDIQRNF